MTGNRIGGVKLIWTVDQEKARIFSPRCDMLLTHIKWGGMGGVYYFTQALQENIMQQVGRGTYIKLPRPGTSPRGVEISTHAMRLLATHNQSLKIPVKWEKEEMQFDPYERWVELWEQG